MTSNPNDYRAVSINPKSYNIEDIYDHMSREGSTVTKAEALAGFEEVMQCIIELVGQGYSVTTPLVNISSAVSGVFDGEGDRFDAGRHQVNINVSTGKRLKKSADGIPIERVTPRQRLPVPLQFIDQDSDTQNKFITPGGGAKIYGSLLKFDEEDRDQGIFFINLENGFENRVEDNILRNKPRELIFINPDLPTGSYRLEVRSMIKDTTVIRTGRHQSKLMVTDS